MEIKVGASASYPVGTYYGREEYLPVLGTELQ